MMPPEFGSPVPAMVSTVPLTAAGLGVPQECSPGGRQGSKFDATAAHRSLSRSDYDAS
jgi:hypothetical protein